MEKRIVTIKISLLHRCNRCHDVINFADGLSLFKVSRILEALKRGELVGILCPACETEAIFDDYNY